MKKLLFILLAVIITLSSCTQKKPVVKKERIVSVTEVIVPTLIEKGIPTRKIIDTTIIEYNKDGYKIKEIIYKGFMDGEISYIYNGKDATDIRRISKAYFKNDGKLYSAETYYDKVKGKWVAESNGKLNDVEALKFENLTDDLIAMSTDIRSEDEDGAYKGQYTKFDDNGNWIEAVEEITYASTGSVHKTKHTREILEMW